MLVLTRKQRESIVIGGSSEIQPGLTVTVLEIRNGKVKLGFEADPSISVRRMEVWERKRAGELPEGRAEDFTASRVS